MMLPDLETNTGEKVDASVLAGKVVALYFSAHWCPPCRGFTPKLAAAFEMANEDSERFQVVFVSSDESAEAQANYMAEMHGNWLRVPFASPTRDFLKQKYGCFVAKEQPLWPSVARRNGIPSLVVIGPAGEELEFDGVGVVAKAGVPEAWFSKFMDATAAGRVAIEAAWVEFSKDGQFKKAQLGAMMRKEQEEWGQIWSDNDYPNWLKEQFASMAGSEDRNAVATKAQFFEWYPTFATHLDGVKAAALAEQAARDAEREAKAAKPCWEGKLWSCAMPRLDEAINTAWEAGKVPLIVDASYNEGERESGFSPLETFYSYSTACFVEMKKLSVQVAVKKEKTIEQAKDEVAKQLLAAIKTGNPFVMLCSTGVPPLEKYFDAEKLPKEVLAAAAVREAQARDNVHDTLFGPMVKRFEEDNKGKAAPWGTILRVHEGFRTVVVTKFLPDGEDSYEGFLKDTFPLDQMQAIKVVIAD